MSALPPAFDVAPRPHCLLSYGLHEGQLRHVAAVANGLACGCKCPGCGARLVARNRGRCKTAHFAHHQAPECAHGPQTALHLLAKESFLTRPALLLPGATGRVAFSPAFWASFSFAAADYQHHIPLEVFEDNAYCFPVRRVTIQSVALEHRTGDVVPDIALETDGGPLLVEVAVTHFIDDHKREKLRRLGVSTLEIDLSAVARDIGRDELEQVLLHQTRRKTWAFNAKLEAKLRERQHRYEEAARPHFEQMHAAVQAAQQREQEKDRRYQQQREERARARVTQRKPIMEWVIPQHRTANQVLSCPKRRRIHQGTTYANVEADCHRCPHYRGYHDRKQFITCGHDVAKLSQR